MGAEPPRNMADQLTLFKPRGADYAPHTTASPPGFKKLSTPLQYVFSLLEIGNIFREQEKYKITLHTIYTYPYIFPAHMRKYC